MPRGIKKNPGPITPAYLGVQKEQAEEATREVHEAATETQMLDEITNLKEYIGQLETALKKSEGQIGFYKGALSTIVNQIDAQRNVLTLFMAGGNAHGN